MNSSRYFHDTEFEAHLGKLLRAGVIISAVTVLTGGFLYLIQHGGQAPHYHTFRGEPEELKNFKLIFEGVIRFHSVSIIQMGLLFLFATPIARVIFSIFGFSREKDFRYVIVSLIVLLIIGFSIFNGIAI
jgi:uncharacterized membrane protein